MVYCPHCGSEVQAGRNPCPHCGRELPEARWTSAGEEAALAISGGPEPGAAPVFAPAGADAAPVERRGGGRTWRLALGAAAAMLVAGLLAAFLLGFNRTPKQQFFLAASRSFQEMWKGWREAAASQLELSRRQYTEPHTVRGKVTLDFEAEELPPEVTAFRQILKDSALVVESLQDLRQRSILVDIGYQYQGNEVIDAQLAWVGDQIGIRVPALYDRYVVLENRNLREQFRNRGIPYAGPDRFITTWDYLDVITLKPEELRAIARSYGKYLYDSIRDDEVTLTRGVEYQSPAGPIKVQQLTLRLSEERVREILAGLGTRFQGDAETLDLLAGQVAAVARLLVDSGYTDPGLDLERWTDKEFVRWELSRGAGSWAAEVRNLNLPGGLEVSLLLGPGGRIVQHQVRFGVQADGEVIRAQVTLDTWQDRDKARTGKFRVHLAPEGMAGRDELEFTVESRTRSAGQEMTADATMTLLARTAGREDGRVTVRMNGTRIPLADGWEQQKVRLDMTSSGADTMEFPGTLRLEVDQRFRDRLKSGLYDQHMDFSFTFEEPETGLMTVRIASERTVDFTRPVTFPQFGPDTALNVLTASDAELEELVRTVEERLQDFLMRNVQLFALALEGF